MIRVLRAVLALFVLGLSSNSQALPAIEDFFKKPQISAPKLSPGGRYLAIQLVAQDGFSRLAILDLEHPALPPKVVAGFADADIYQHHWVTEERLVFDTTLAQNGTSRARRPGLWAVNRDGSDFKQLIAADRKGMQAGTQIADRRLELNWALHSVPGDDSGDVVVERHRYADEPDSMGIGLARLNTSSGKLSKLAAGAPDYVSDWVLDAEGIPAALSTLREGIYTSYYRNPTGEWQQWQRAQAYGGNYETPYWFGGDLALVSGQLNGYTVLYRVDRKTMQREAQPLVSFKGYDYRGRLVYDAPSRQLLGLHYETDAPGSYWLHPKLRQWQAEVDAKLPGSANRIDCRRECLTAPHLLVTAYSDQVPERYFLYTPASGEMRMLSASRPWIKPSEMGQRDMVRIKARDGLELPVLVTVPPSKAQAARPAVLLVHGGPYVRGTHWPWEPMAQFLASRGYVVIEPEFRGSTGYGQAHFKAGWKQWGLAMQDDVADALGWAVKQGLVDPKRVCIAGASYGGYATLMGLIKQPELYRCGINWVGVTDIELLYSIHWSDLGGEWKGYGMPVLVGDRDKDAEQLRTTSPLQRAAELKRPLLMAYGAEDRRVPLKHGLAFRDAMPKDQELEWVVYDHEGHGWRELKTQQDFWGRVERFLACHLGAAP